MNDDTLFLTDEDTAVPGERAEQRLERRSASVLKHRLLEQERKQFDESLAWAKSDGALERAAALIVSARRRFLIGASKSFTYASLLAADLSYGLANVTLIDGTIVRPLDVLSDVRTSDVMIAVSLQRYRKYTIDSVVPFAQAGGSLVLITDAPDAPLTPYANETIVLARAEDGHPSSSIGIALTLHILATLTTASAKGAGRRAVERERLAETLGVYVSDEG